MKAARIVAALVVASALGLSPVFAQDQRPTATISVANSTCTTANAHTTLNTDVDAPGNDWCDAVADDTDHDIMLRFDTTADLSTAANAQAFAVFVRRSATGGNDPAVALDAFRGSTCATSVQNNQNQTITSDTGQIITDTWTADVTDGSQNRCLELDCARSGGASASRRSCDYDAAEWRATFAAGRRVIIIGARLTADGIESYTLDENRNPIEVEGVGVEVVRGPRKGL